MVGVERQEVPFSWGVGARTGCLPARRRGETGISLWTPAVHSGPAHPRHGGGPTGEALPGGCSMCPPGRGVLVTLGLLYPPRLRPQRLPKLTAAYAAVNFGNRDRELTSTYRVVFQSTTAYAAVHFTIHPVPLCSLRQFRNLPAAYVLVTLAPPLRSPTPPGGFKS